MQTITATIVGSYSEVWNFKFSKVATKSIEKYFVHGESNRSQKVAFEMRKQFSRWKVLPPVPEDIAGLEEQLSLHIETVER